MSKKKTKRIGDRQEFRHIRWDRNSIVNLRHQPPALLCIECYLFVFILLLCGCQADKQLIGSDYRSEQLAQADALAHRGLAAFHSGQYAEAQTATIAAARIRKNVLGEEHQHYAATISDLARQCFSVGDYGQAEPLLLRARDILRKVRGEEHPEYAASLNNLAKFHELTGDYSKAEPLYLQACDILAKARGEENSEYATALGNLGKLYQLMGDYARAEPLYLKAREILKKSRGEEHPEYATALTNLGSLYLLMSDYLRAEPLYLQSRDIRKQVGGQEHPGYAAALGNLATLYQFMGQHVRAESLYLQCLDIRKQASGQEHPSYAATLGNLGTLYQLMGDYTRAEFRYLQARDHLKQSLGEEHPDYAFALGNLGNLYRLKGDYVTAGPLYLQCRDIQSNVLGEKHPAFAITLLNQSKLYRAMERPESAEAFAIEALHLARLLLDESAIILSERQQLAMSQEFRAYLDSYLSLAIDRDVFHGKAGQEVLRWKGATLARQRAMRLAADDTEIADHFRRLQRKSRQLASLSRTTPLAELDDWQQRINRLTEAKERLEAQLSRDSATFRAAIKEASSEQIQAAIPFDGVLIDFLEFNRSQLPEKLGDFEFTPWLLAVVVKRTGEPKLIDLGPIEPLRKNIDTWRQTFGMTPSGKQAGQAVRRQIWEPLLEHIGEFETVLVSTDGVLGRLPLAALPGKEPGTYLLEDHRLAMIPVPRLLPSLMNGSDAKEPSRKLLLLGDVDYNSEPERTLSRRSGTRSVPTGAQFKALPGAADEVASIEALYTDLFKADADGVTTLKQSAASESSVCELAGQFRHLHLATHGFFAAPEHESALRGRAIRSASDRSSLASRNMHVTGFNPGLLSGLALAGANREPIPGKDDGILTAQEIAFLPLGGVDTVVLSACETGLGEVAGGEGLIGIQRAFQIAGAHTTVASLWSVNDVVTRRLMERFYRNLWEKEMTRLDALREAQLSILNDPKSIKRESLEASEKEFTHVSQSTRGASMIGQHADGRVPPYYWAAFQLSGDWR